MITRSLCIIFVGPWFIAISLQLRWIWSGLMIVCTGPFQSALYRVLAFMLDGSVGLWLVFGFLHFLFLSWYSVDFFYPTIGIHQGYPLSPYLFICCADILFQVFQVVASSSGLDPYTLVLGAQLSSYLMFADDYFLQVGHPSEIQWPFLRFLRRTIGPLGGGWTSLSLLSYSTQRLRSSLGMPSNKGESGGKGGGLVLLGCSYL